MGDGTWLFSLVPGWWGRAGAPTKHAVSATHTHIWRRRVENPMRSGFSLLRGCLGLGCCVFCAAAKWVPTADHPANAGLVGHLLLLYWCSGRVGRGAGAISLLHQLPSRWLFLESPVARAAWVAPRFKPSLANPVAGGRLRYPR